MPDHEYPTREIERKFLDWSNQEEWDLFLTLKQHGAWEPADILRHQWPEFYAWYLATKLKERVDAEQ